MKTNSKIPFFDVVYMSRELCRFLTGDEYYTIYIPIKLKDNGELKDYIAAVNCRKEEVAEAMMETSKLNGIDKDKFSVNKKYCHIATYLENEIRQYISFSEEDDCPIKASINSEYQFVDNFFKSFIDFRNNLISKKQTVKRDDLYQYYLSITGFTEEEKKKKQKMLTK